MRFSGLLATVHVAVLVGACGVNPGPGRRDAGTDTTDLDTGPLPDVPLDFGPADHGDLDANDDVRADRPRPGDDDGGSDDGGGLEDVTEAGPEAAVDSGACTVGSISCSTTDRARTCLADGGYAESDCADGKLCVNGLGCTVCEPGAVRCGGDGLTLETCAPDGMSWTAGTRCNTAVGEVCEGYRCVSTCARAAGQRSYLGCEYWPTTMSNSQLGTSFTFAVTVANPQPYPVTVTFSGGALTTPRTATVAPNTTHTEELPWVSALAQLGTSAGANSALQRGGAYRVTSTAPVAAYQFNPLRFVQGGSNSFTNDASLLLPTHVLTGNYTAITHQTWYSLGGQIVIVGVNETPTTVRVNLRAAIRAGTGVAAAGPGLVTYTLGRGDVLMLTGGGTTSLRTCTTNDLTGSTITADQPVAVFVGHDCTNMPCDSAACDHLEEQLFPNETWGSRFVVSALRERSAAEVSVVRILSQRDGNALSFDGISPPATCPATLNANQFCEFETASDFAVRGTEPTLIAQFMVGQDRVPGVGDPAMVLEVATQQFRTNYVFNVPASYTNNFLTVVYPTGQRPQLDGTTIATGTVVGSSGYSVTRFTVSAGSHTMRGPAPFGIKVSGTAQYTSYMYPGGLDLNQITSR